LLSIRHWSMAIGDFLPEIDMNRAAPVCVLGAVLRREFFGEEPPIGKWMRIGDRRCRVIGVLSTEGRSVGIDVGEILVIPVASGQALFNSPALFRIIAQGRSRETLIKGKADLIRIIKDRHYGEEDVTVITQDAVLGTFDTIFNAVTMALAGIASISLIVAGVLIMNVMLVAVSQRTEEIGLLKALGAKRRQIIALFLTEAGFLSIAGAVAGLMFGYAAVFILRRVFPALDFTPPLWAVGAALGVAMASGLLFGILPARRAALLEPVAALARQ
ncbi:MAG: FtsX-like permease family protein, partial [Gammaproteobacteria bacterium]